MIIKFPLHPIGAIPTTHWYGYMNAGILIHPADKEVEIERINGDEIIFTKEAGAKGPPINKCFYTLKPKEELKL